MKHILLLIFAISAIAFPQVKFSGNFESGNLNTVSTTDSVNYTVTSKEDITGRWFYFKMMGVKNKFISVRVSNTDCNRPVYSYDNRNFISFSESESPSQNLFRKTYEQDTVYVAYFVPYNFSYMQERIAQWKQSQYVHVDTLGFTQKGLPIQEIRITDTSVPDSGKYHVWVHARTHPSETPSSWHFDGLVQQLLSNDDVIKFYRQKIVYHCIPFTNPDGVYYGKARVNYSNVDVESNWNESDAQTTQEVKILKARMAAINAQKPIAVFQNLHAQASQFCTFWIHTASSTTSQFYRRQLQFANLNVSGNPCFTPADYSFSNLSMTFPEGWLWTNNKEKTLALTYETPFDYYSTKLQVTTDNLKSLGVRSVYAISEFLELSHPKYYLLDNNSIVSNWKADSTSGTGFYSKNFLYTATALNKGPAVFSTDELDKGNYDVYSWWPSSNSFAYDAKTTIEADGAKYEIVKSQQINGAQWNFIKNINLSSPGKIKISVSDSASGYVVADAFKIVYNGEPLNVARTEGVKDFALMQNYPNPFNPSTTISWKMKSAGKVSLKVYDALGRLVSTLVNDERKPGSYKQEFNAKNLSSGVYYYRLTVDSFTESKAMILLK